MVKAGACLRACTTALMVCLLALARAAETSRTTPSSVARTARHAQLADSAPMAGVSASQGFCSVETRCALTPAKIPTTAADVARRAIQPRSASTVFAHASPAGPCAAEPAETLTPTAMPAARAAPSAQQTRSAFRACAAALQAGRSAMVSV